MMKLSPKVSQEIYVIERLSPVKFLITHVLQETPPVKSHLGNGRVQFDPGVPCSAFCCAEAGAIRSRVGKSSVHNVRLGNAKNQFVRTDTCPSAALRYLSFIGCGFNLAQIGENVLRKVQRLQSTSLLTIFLWN